MLSRYENSWISYVTEELRYWIYYVTNDVVIIMWSLRSFFKPSLARIDQTLVDILKQLPSLRYWNKRIFLIVNHQEWTFNFVYVFARIKMLFYGTFCKTLPSVRLDNILNRTISSNDYGSNRWLTHFWRKIYRNSCSHRSSHNYQLCMMYMYLEHEKLKHSFSIIYYISFGGNSSSETHAKARVFHCDHITIKELSQIFNLILNWP